MCVCVSPVHLNLASDLTLLTCPTLRPTRQRRLQRRHVWWIQPPCLVPCPTHYAASSCSAMWWGRQGSKGHTRLVGLLSSAWQIPKCWLLFLSWGVSVLPSETAPYTNWVPCSSIFMLNFWFLLCLLYQQSAHKVCFLPSEICICWTTPSKDLSSTCLLTLKNSVPFLYQHLEVHSLSTGSLNSSPLSQDFLTSMVLTSGARQFFFVGDFPVHIMMFSGTLDFYLLKQ